MAGCLGNSDGDPSTPTTNSTDETPGTTSTPAEPATPDRIEGSWPMPGADAGRSNYNPDSPGPTAQVTQLWERRAESTLSAPVLADETLYLGEGSGGVLAVDARTGERRWHQSLDSATGRPWVHNGTVYAQTDEQIVALDSTEGTERWRVEQANPLLVAPHGLYVVAPATSHLVALEPADGSERWRADINDPWIPTLFASENHVFLSTDTNSPVPWGFNQETGEYLDDLFRLEYEARLTSSGQFVHAPGERFYLDGTIYTSDPFYGRVGAHGIEGTYGTRWTTRVGADSSSTAGAEKLAADSEYIYAGTDTRQENTFHAFSLADGSESWHIEGNAKLTARPVVTTENVYVRTADGLRCFATADGTERWSLPDTDIGTHCIVVDDLLYTTDDKTVRAFRPV
jgi:outer membrane protein assembly factor BamB